MVRSSLSPLSDVRNTSRSAENAPERSTQPQEEWVQQLEGKSHTLQQYDSQLKAEGRRTYPAVQRRVLPPQAPTSEEVAQRILSHCAMPIKRFDSADFFLEQEKQKKAPTTEAALADASAVRTAASGQMVQLIPFERPPPLSFACAPAIAGATLSPVARSRRS